jgi:hypothetical protein
MQNDEAQSRMPLSMVATQGVGAVSLLAGLIVMFTTDALARSGTRPLFEALMLSGRAAYLVVAFRYWRCRKARRSRQSSADRFA